MSEALACLTRLLASRKRLAGLEVVRESCLRTCPFGRICVTLQHGGREVTHHLSAGDDLQTVAARLAGTART